MMWHHPFCCLLILVFKVSLLGCYCALLMMTVKVHLFWGMYENRNDGLLSYHVEFIIQHIECSKHKTIHHPTAGQSCFIPGMWTPSVLTISLFCITISEVPMRDKMRKIHCSLEWFRIQLGEYITSTLVEATADNN